MQEGRWTSITPSQFAHEREALAHLQGLLPDTEPFRAWSNFTFTADTGHPYEVDLLVATPGGLHLIEIKSFTGRLISSGSNWIHQQSGGGVRTLDNPLHLADAKAKRLKSLLQAAAAASGGGRNRVRVPFIQAAVFLSKPGLKVALSDHHRHNVYGPQPPADRQPAASGDSADLPPIGTGLLLRPPSDERHRVTPELSRALPGLLEKVGIARSRRHLQIGSWELQPRPFDVGPTWQDHHATHRELPRERRRVRIYLVERNAVQAQRASIERAARREMRVLHGISHPNIVQVDAMEPHEAGPALVFRHDPRWLRLDHYLAQYGDRLEPASRVTMIRQLAETLAYAHGRHLHHRALSARSIFVTPAPGRRRRGNDEEGWLYPQLLVSDWQAATRAADGAGSATVGTAGAGSDEPILASSHAADHLERSAEAYLAPELSSPAPDPVAMDVFGLGAVAYLILTGQPPAGKRTELLARLAKENGLRASAVTDTASQFADELIQAATAPVPTQRLTTVAEFVEMLEVVEDELTAPPSPPAITPTAPADATDPAAGTATDPVTGAAPDPSRPEPEPVQEPVQIDPLEARPGDTVGEWTITKRLGTGSTCRAFLAHNDRTGRDEVLKVGLSDEKAARLAREAEVLGPLTDSRVIRLARPDPLRIGNRTLIVLEHAGERTLARQLRDEGRLTVDELENYSDYLFGALDYLEGEGVYHRDIKPDNIAIRIRTNRTRQLVLFDFSLAAVSVKEITAGTPRYLDPFLGTAERPVFDRSAEWYALAVTLHEMASGELPVWGDGATEPQLTEGPPLLAAEAFDPAIRDGLIAFFEEALHRDARRRFSSLKDMRDAWQRLFRQSDASAPAGTDHPEPVDDEIDADAAAAARDEAATRATRATALESAGLTPRAISAAHRLDANTVGDLLTVAPRLAHLRGLGARTRQELQRRVKEWRARLGEREPVAASQAERRAASAEATPVAVGVDGDVELLRVGLDAIAALLVPAPNTRNPTEAQATRLLLALPDARGVLPDLPPWPRQPLVAKAVSVTPGRIAQILGKQRRRWRGLPVVRSLRTQVIGLLADSGRVMSVDELAAALLASRGSVRTGEQLRMAVARAAVRAAIEIDALEDDQRLLLRRHSDTHPGSAGDGGTAAGPQQADRQPTVREPAAAADRLLVALEAGDDDPPDTPTAPALLDYADALGRAADRLADSEVLPSPATVLRTLAGVSAPGGAAEVVDERRRVTLAAAAAQRAAANARLEIYPKDLSPVRALRLSQAGVLPAAGPGQPTAPTDAPPTGSTDASDVTSGVTGSVRRQATLTAEQIAARVRGRFPELAPLPPPAQLDKLLAQAGFDLRMVGDVWVAPPRPLSSSMSIIRRRSSASTPTTSWLADSPELAAALRAEERLSAPGDGFRALTVRLSRYPAAADELVRRFGARPVSVADRFLRHLRALVDSRPKPTWKTVLGADLAEPGSRAALKFGEYVDEAWQRTLPELLAELGATTPPADSGSPAVSGASAAPGWSAGPLLLHDAAPLARWRSMPRLDTLAEAARSGAGTLWLLCPAEDPQALPKLDGEVVRVSENEWIPLPDAWVANAHRSVAA